MLGLVLVLVLVLGLELVFGVALELELALVLELELELVLELPPALELGVALLLLGLVPHQKTLALAHPDHWRVLIPVDQLEILPLELVLGLALLLVLGQLHQLWGCSLHLGRRVQNRHHQALPLALVLALVLLLLQELELGLAPPPQMSWQSPSWMGCLLHPVSPGNLLLVQGLSLAKVLGAAEVHQCH